MKVSSNLRSYLNKLWICSYLINQVHVILSYSSQTIKTTLVVYYGSIVQPTKQGEKYYKNYGFVGAQLMIEEFKLALVQFVSSGKVFNFSGDEVKILLMTSSQLGNVILRLATKMNSRKIIIF